MAIAAKPDFGRAWGNLGVALASSGDVEGAPTDAIRTYRIISMAI